MKTNFSQNIFFIIFTQVGLRIFTEVQLFTFISLHLRLYFFLSTQITIKRSPG